jgi:hypothetical protein
MEKPIYLDASKISDAEKLRIVRELEVLLRAKPSAATRRRMVLVPQHQGLEQMRREQAGTFYWFMARSMLVGWAVIEGAIAGVRWALPRLVEVVATALALLPPLG